MSSTQPPPNYVRSSPQILIAPLQDSPSFFRGQLVQGEVFVKGLGETPGYKSGVRDFTIQLNLTTQYPNEPTTQIHNFPSQTLYPPLGNDSSSNSNATIPFPTLHQFNIPLLPTLPGSLNLEPKYGSITYTLRILLTLISGEIIAESIQIEGTPSTLDDDIRGEEVEEVLERKGVRTRVLVDTPRPRLGSLLRLGVEIRPIPKESPKISSSDDSPARALRPLRRVRVEFFRRVRIVNTHNQATPTPTSSTSSDLGGTDRQHLQLLYTSGKSLRYPGSNSRHPPLRVLFTIPTINSSSSDQTWGEISQLTQYHEVGFFVRVSIGFGSGGGSDGGAEARDWVLQVPITILKRRWVTTVQNGSFSLGEVDQGYMDEDARAREMYRRKGLDVVGTSGTYRKDAGVGVDMGTRVNDLPPPFEAGPSTNGVGGDGGLPSFLESEEQVRGMAEARVNGTSLGDRDRATSVGRRGSLGGELGGWVEYDGYETFSSPPPSLSASFGVGGIMDPPQPGEDEADGLQVVGGMVARLGLNLNLPQSNGRELIERLGLGEGTRVVDLQDDLPPGIDEPSLPALPGFGERRRRESGVLPPSFADSEAAQAVGGVATSGTGLRGTAVGNVGGEREGDGDGEAPPGYFGGTISPGHGMGPPAYS